MLLVNDMSVAGSTLLDIRQQRPNYAETVQAFKIFNQNFANDVSDANEFIIVGSRLEETFNLENLWFTESFEPSFHDKRIKAAGSLNEEDFFFEISDKIAFLMVGKDADSKTFDPQIHKLYQLDIPSQNYLKYDLPETVEEVFTTLVNQAVA